MLLTRFTDYVFAVIRIEGGDVLDADEWNQLKEDVDVDEIPRWNMDE